MMDNFVIQQIHFVYNTYKAEDLQSIPNRYRCLGALEILLQAAGVLERGQRLDYKEIEVSEPGWFLVNRKTVKRLERYHEFIERVVEETLLNASIEKAKGSE